MDGLQYLLGGGSAKESEVQDLVRGVEVAAGAEESACSLMLPNSGLAFDFLPVFSSWSVDMVRERGRRRWTFSSQLNSVKLPLGCRPTKLSKE